MLLDSQFRLSAVREWDERDTNDHWKVLDEKVQEIFNESHINPRVDIKKIFCVHGPGGYTGLRIAASYAQGMALSLGVDLVGISSFDLAGESFFIPVRHQKARDLKWEEALDQGFEFLKILNSNEAQLATPKDGDKIWGFADSEIIAWPSQEQLINGVMKNFNNQENFKVFYGLGAKVFGNYLAHT